MFIASGSPEKFNDTVWAAAALATGLAIVAMQLTGTRHPPAGIYPFHPHSIFKDERSDFFFTGSTALLAAVNPQVRDLGWYFLGIVMLSSVIVVAIAIISNNIQRNYPTFWFYYTDKMGDTLEMPEPEMMDSMGRDRRYSTLPIIHRNREGRFSTQSAFSTFSGMTTVKPPPPAVVVTDATNQKEFTSSDLEKQIPGSLGYI